MSKIPVVVGLGETLWDVFPDGAHLGGAPLNFSCSAAELAQSHAQVFIVSSVGNDELGRRAVDSLTEHGVDTTCMQTDDRQTGQVLVELDSAGVASYRFAEIQRGTIFPGTVPCGSSRPTAMPSASAHWDNEVDARGPRYRSSSAQPLTKRCVFWM